MLPESSTITSSCSESVSTVSGMTSASISSSDVVSICSTLSVCASANSLSLLSPSSAAVVLSANSICAGYASHTEDDDVDEDVVVEELLLSSVSNCQQVLELQLDEADASD